MVGLVAAGVAVVGTFVVVSWMGDQLVAQIGGM